MTGFIRVKPEHLHAFPRTAEGTGGPWPSRRVWAMLAASLANVRDDDAASRQAITFGLVGEGVGVEFLTWCQQADLPDPVCLRNAAGTVYFAEHTRIPIGIKTAGRGRG